VAGYMPRWYLLPTSILVKVTKLSTKFDDDDFDVSNTGTTKADCHFKVSNVIL